MVLVKTQEQKINLPIDRKPKMQPNINNIYGLIWGQCNDDLYWFMKG